MPGNAVYAVQPNLFQEKSGTLSVTELHDHDLTTVAVNSFINTAGDLNVGLSAIYGPKNVLKIVALSTRSAALVIRLSPNKAGQRRGRSSTIGTSLLQDRLLCNSNLKKLAFDADRVSTALYHDYGLFITKVIDAQSLVLDTRWSTATLLQVLGGETVVNRKEITKLFIGSEKSNNEGLRSALMAWATWHITTLPRLTKAIETAEVINTQPELLDTEILCALAVLTRNLDRLRAMKPTVVKNDISPDYSQKKGDLTLALTRFKTRARPLPSENQRMELRAPLHGCKSVTIEVQKKRVDGRQLVVKLQGRIPTSATQLNLYTFGREDPTCAEQERTSVVLAVLQSTRSFFSLPLARAIFLGEGGKKAFMPCKPLTSSDIVPVAHCHIQDRPLNPSQMLAVKRILSPLVRDYVCLIQGPGGTGKTTVIAAAVKAFMANSSQNGRTIWLVAQSNVAVKNIAEKLASTDFWEFKLLVSYDFHFDWHEHLYHRINNNIIRSDAFKDNVIGIERRLGAAKVLLCTLSTFSHPLLVSAGFTRLVPVDTVIIDEASQIEIGDYVPFISKFGKTARKLAFIGDDKQLPPYGQDDLKELQSIFEVKCFRKNMVFLDTQYRMPVPIGSFLSKQMYGGRLKSVHSIHDKASCRLVDVHRGKETRAGTSWKNVEEAAAVIRIARHLGAQNKRFRIITPYDGQRGFIEDLLKRERLPWEDKCFCVDSFQGNEEDHIIISIVRSDKVGFLSNRRRSNVMLSRCKQSMYICTGRSYLSGIASATLLGTLAKQWGPDAWEEVQEIVGGR